MKNKNKYFKIVKHTTAIGKVVYCIYGTNSILDVIFNVWDEYKLKHEKYSDAAEHLGYVSAHCYVVNKTVYRYKNKPAKRSAKSIINILNKALKHEKTT